jgi:putative SOS response-associated peptidase YedK
MAGKGKAPYRIMLKNEELFTFAGLRDESANKSTGEVLHTFTIITIEANDVVKPIHDKMPVFLTPEAEEMWLDENEPQEGFTFTAGTVQGESNEGLPCIVTGELANQ